MSMTVHHERANIYRVEIRGMLQKIELAQSEAALLAEIRRIGAVRLLVVLDTFEGWGPHDNWSDLAFYAKHGHAIERIAIVGEEQWRGEALMFAGADLRPAPVEFFSTSKAADARVWLSA